MFNLDHKEFDLDKIKLLPSAFAFSLERFVISLEEGKYWNALNDALYVFEISSQFVSCLLIALLQEKSQKSTQEGSLSRRLKSIIKILDDKRNLSTGDWVESIFVPILETAGEDLKDEQFIKSLYELCCKANHRNNPFLSCKEFPLGIASIRNTIKHDMRLAEDIAAKRLEEYMIPKRLALLVKAFTPLQEWSFFSSSDIAEKEAKKFILNDQSPKDASLLEFKENHYYAYRQGRNGSETILVDLFPLVFCNEGNIVYIFQTLTKNERINYVSSNQYAERIHIDKLNGAFNARLQQILPQFDISRNLNLVEIQELTNIVAEAYLKEKRYDRDLYVDRSQLNELFQDFKESSHQLFPLCGEAGQGKTYQLCRWTEQLLADEKAVVLPFSCTSFAKVSLTDKLRDVFDFSPKKSLQTKLSNLHQTLVNNETTLFFLFDALNECLAYKNSSLRDNASLRLYQDICALLVSSKFPNFKVLITCRSYTWLNNIKPFETTDAKMMFTPSFGKTEDELEVRGFTKAEFQVAFTKYKTRYQIKTQYEDLSASVRIRLRDPLVFRFVCANYMHQEWPKVLSSYSSLTLFARMLEEIAHTEYGTLKHQLLQELALYTLVMYEKGSYTGGIPLVFLHEAYNDISSPLHPIARLAYESESRGTLTEKTAFRDLLADTRNPVIQISYGEDDNNLSENTNDLGQLKFVHERFLEYLMAQAFLEREKQAYPSDLIPANKYVEILSSPHVNSVYMGIIRNVLLLDYLHTNNPQIIIELISYHHDEPNSKLLIQETLNVLIRENYEEHLFSLVENFLFNKLHIDTTLVDDYNELQNLLETGRIDDHLITKQLILSKQLAPLIRLREQASLTVVNGIFLTDYFNEDVYQKDPFTLLLMLLNDPLIDVRNNTIKYCYYLSREKYTQENSPLNENLTKRIIDYMFFYLTDNSMLKLSLSGKNRKQAIGFLEIAGRLSFLLITDLLKDQSPENNKEAVALINDAKEVIKHLTLNYRLIGPLLYLTKTIIRRQFTSFTSMYVNNGIEYQTFWNQKIIPLKSNQTNEWSREALNQVINFLDYYLKYSKISTDFPTSQNPPDFLAYHKTILAAYRQGDSFSYFVLERIMIIMGLCDWNYLKPIITAFFSQDYQNNEWYDYSQMSMLYVLFQVAIQSQVENDEILEIFEAKSAEWTRRCRGYFKGRNSHLANPIKLYKRNIMNWYCQVYAKSINMADHSLSDRSYPMFYQLLDEAIEQKDKELLYHLMECIIELITDANQTQTALTLTKHIMSSFSSLESIREFDSITIEHNNSDHQNEGLVDYISNILSTAKKYQNNETDNFIRNDITATNFPVTEKYRSELLNYHPSGEKLSDLFTHRFGSFLIWSLINVEAINQSIYNVLREAEKSNDFYSWFDKAAQIIIKDLLGIRL